MPQGAPQYLDAQGNPIDAPATLDAQGNPLSSEPHQPTEAEWAAMPVGEKMRNVLQVAGKAIGGAFFPGGAGAAAVDHPVATLATAAVPGVLSVAGKYGGPAIRATAETVGNVLSKPTVGAGIGAAEGYRRNGVEGAVMGAAAGYTGSSATGRLLQRLGLNEAIPASSAANTTASQRMVQGMSQAATPPHLDPDALLEAAIQRGIAKGEASLAARTAPQPPPIPTASPKAASSLEQEILARISAEPDWRSVDAVPINAMKTKGIVEPGESRVGLAERMAQAMKTDPAEAERLAKALRQRMHISAKK